MPIETTAWDPAERLDSEEAIISYLDHVMESGDPAIITAAIGDVARARGMSKVARAAGLSRESLYRALSPEGNPEFGTVLRVMKAIGIRLTTAPA